MYHIVLIPKYRKRVLRGRIASRIEELLRECVEVNSWELHELNIQADHVYMLVQLKPSISVSKAVQLFKSGSSKVIREEFPELEEYLWGESFWADGFFSETVGQVNSAVIREYIKNQ